MRSPLRLVREMVAPLWSYDVSRTVWWGRGRHVLRSFFQSVQFFRQPAAQGTTIDYDLARSLYRNDCEFKYGAGFVKPIIDLPVEYMGLPTVTSEDGNDEAYLNECIRDYWAPQLQQALRDASRDSKTIIRFYQPRIDNPLFTSSDRDHGCIEVVPPETVTIFFNPVDKNLIDKAIVLHEVEVDERTLEEELNNAQPRVVKHTIVETITPSGYTYYDRTAGADLTTWNVVNNWRFVPLWPIWNEYDASLGGGQSDIESCFEFIRAFHDVMTDVLSAHSYHSIPKVKLSVKSVENFIANNWPGAVGDDGKVKQDAQISWQGHEIFFFGPDEDGGFIEAQSVLGDSKSLLDFLIDCICVSSETPRWALLANDKALSNSASVEPFKKKVERKRVQFTELFVMACKMALVANGKVPLTPRLNWPPVALEDLASKGQSLQQLILGLDVAGAHGWLSDLTAVKILATFFPEMNSPEVEMALAANNKPAVPPPAAPSVTQAIAPVASAAPTGQLATTAASKS